MATNDDSLWDAKCNHDRVCVLPGATGARVDSKHVGSHDVIVHVHVCTVHIHIQSPSNRVRTRICPSLHHLDFTFHRRILRVFI